MREARVTAPASLSFIFKSHPHNDPVKAGSTGVGCTIDKKVTVIAREDPHPSLSFNNSALIFPTGTFVLEKLTQKPVAIDIRSPLPLGFGFGISGAASLGIAFALNTLLHLGKTKEELVKIAHTAEIVHRTGLGSVGTQITGGFLIKNKPGLPVSARRLPFTGDKLYAVIIDRLTTPSVLEDRDRVMRINRAGERALSKIQEKQKIVLKDILDISYIFAKESGLLVSPVLLSIIDTIRKSGGSATMTMLGKVIITNQKPSLKENCRIEELIITDDTVELF